MANQLESRIIQLESRVKNLKELVPGMVYFSTQTREEAEVEYLQQNGFKLSKDAPVIQIVCMDASKRKLDS